MTMDVSTLGIVVKSQGIDEATDSLNNLGKAAASAEQNVTKLVTALNNVGKSNPTSVMQALTNTIATTNSVTQALNQSFNQMNIQLNITTSTVNNYAAAIRSASTASSDHISVGGVFTNTLKAMTAAALAYSGVNLVKNIVDSADAWQNFNGRLTVATGSQNNATLALQQLFGIAQETRQPMTQLVEVYSRFAPAFQRMGQTGQQTMDALEGISLSLALNHATASEASSAWIQLGHAASSGLVPFRVFSTLVRSDPLLMNAFVDGVHNGSIQIAGIGNASELSMRQIEKLGTAGKIPFTALAQAATDSLGKMREEFDKIPVTFGGALQILKNTWLQSIGQMGLDTGFNKQLAEALLFINKMIPAVAQGLGQAFVSIIQWVQANLDKISQIWTQITGLATDVVALVGDFGLVAGAVAGAGGEVSLLASAIFGIRLGLATIQDILNGIAAAATLLAPVMYLILQPILLIVTAIGALQEGFVLLQGLAAKGLDAIGSHEQAAALRDQAAQNKIIADQYSSIEFTAGNITKDVLKQGEAWGTADSKVQQLMDSAAKLKATTVDFGYGEYDKTWDTTVRNTPGTDDAAAKKAAQQKKVYEDMMVSLQAVLDEQNKINVGLNTQGLAYDKIGPAQKKLLELEEQRSRLETDHASAALLNYNQREIELAAQGAGEELINEQLKARLTLGKDEIANIATATKAIEDQIKTIEDKKHNGNPAASTQDQLSTVTAQAYSAQGVSDAQNQANGGTDDSTSVMLAQKAAALWKEVADLQKLASLQTTEYTNSVQESFDKMFDASKLTKFTTIMESSFGKLGKSIGGVVNAYRTYSEGQEKVAVAQEKVNVLSAKGIDTQKDQQLVNELSFSTQMQGYADLTQSMQGFFGKGTIGYKLMGAVSEAFRIAEIAGELAMFLTKAGYTSAFTALFVTSEATKAGAAVGGSAVVVAAEAPKQVAYGISALAASLTIPPPFSFATFAATAALLLGIGIAIHGASGSGKGQSAATQQTQQGTGTVLGDSTKQSESIGNSITLLANNSNIANEYSNQMLASLKSIQSALTGVTNSIALNGANITGSGLVISSAQAGGIAGGIAGAKAALSGNISGAIAALAAVGGFGSSKTLTDSGITSGNQTVGGIEANGFVGQSYQDYTVKHKAFFLTTGTSSQTDKQNLDPTTDAAFTSVITGMVSTITAAGQALGLSSAEIATNISKVQVSLGDISLKGLTSDQITTQLEAVFSALGDKMTTAVLGPAVAAFQQSGEGLLETAVRVASGVEDASTELNKLGLTAISFTDIINKNGDVAAEIVRQSIEMVQAGTGIGAIIQTLSGTAEDIGDTYASLLKAQTALQDLGVAKEVTTSLISAAGGLDALQTALDSYKTNFFTAAQQQAMGIADLTAQFQALGLQMPNSNADFVTLVNTLDASGTSGQALAVKVIGLADAFSQLTSTVQDEISTATSNLTDAYNTQADALTSAQTAFEGFNTSLLAFKQSLTTGDLSTGNAVDKYNSQLALYNSTESAAAGGDQTALGNFQDVANALLTDSQAVYASGDQYTADYNKVLADTTALAGVSSDQATVQQQSLTALQTQVGSLITINTSVLTVAQAITALQNVIATGLGISSATSKATVGVVTPGVDGTHATGLSNVPFDGYIAKLHAGERVLTASQNRDYNGGSSEGNGIEALRAEIAALRQDAQAHAAAIINATVTSNADNAETVVEGTKAAASTAARTANAKPRMN